jgi:hypothetical protein
MRLQRPAHLAGDIAVAVIAVACDVALFSRLGEAESRTSWVTSAPNAFVIVLASLPAVALLMARRRMPVAVSITSCVYAATLTLTIGTRPLFMLLVTLYTASALRPLRLGLLCLASTIAAHGMAVAYEVYSYLEPAERLAGGVPIAAFFVICDVTAWGAGRWTAVARRRERHLEEARDAMAAAIVSKRRSAARGEILERRVFINYRSHDTAHAAGRLGEELMRRLGPDRVFIDVISLRAGSDFRADIAGAIARTAVMLVLVGDRWVRTGDGPERIHDPDDVLRLEIEQALHTGVDVVPLLVDGATLPRPADLPRTLHQLARLNAMTLDARTFRRDVEDLLHRISAVMDDGEVRRRDA